MRKLTASYKLASDFGFVSEISCRQSPLLRNLYEKREQELQVYRRFVETLCALEHSVTRIKLCALCRRGDHIDAHSGSPSHGSILGLREAR